MNFTQEQISEILFDLANKGGTNLLLNLTLNAFMKAERSLHQQENPDEYGNGYRYCKAMAHSKELVLKVPRTRSGMFYPSLLAVIRDEDEERRKLIFSLYSKGLTTEQVSSVFEDVYGKDYSKQQISYLMKESKSNVHKWLKRRLESHYLVVYFDAVFVHTRRDESVSKEGYYSFIGVKEDGTREVLAVVNHPTEGALLWEQELQELKKRGVESVGLFVSDALSGVENAVKRVYPNSKHQLCVVHLKRNIRSIFPCKLKEKISAELNEIFQMETKILKPIDGFNKLCTFVDNYATKYPSIKKYRDMRNIGYFTYLEYPEEIRRMIYSNNWNERLNRDYKRVLKMRGAMPSAESVIALMGAVAMERENTTYSYPIAAFRNVEELKRKIIPHSGHCSATLHNIPNEE
jgi:putative transposase